MRSIVLGVSVAFLVFRGSHANPVKDVSSEMYAETVYDKMDANGDGELSVVELNKTLSELGGKTVLNDLLATTPINHGQTIGKSDFKRWWNKEHKVAENWIYLAMMIAWAEKAPQVGSTKGHCGDKNTGHWKEHSACLKLPSLSSGWEWRDPWLSMMMVSNSRLGGCLAVRFDCASTNVEGLFNYYKAHDSMLSGPPIGTLLTVDYVLCCLKSQCRDPMSYKCGNPPIHAKKKTTSSGSPSPCGDEDGDEGCARLFSNMTVVPALKHEHLLVAVSALGVLGIVGVLLWARRRSYDMNESGTFEPCCLHEAIDDPA